MKTKKLILATRNCFNAQLYNKGKDCWLVFGNTELPLVFSRFKPLEALLAFEAIDLPFDRSESFSREGFQVGEECYVNKVALD